MGPEVDNGPNADFIWLKIEARSSS
jgi:hypothetical protein